jgi:predicted nicotinamide N-methyase
MDLTALLDRLNQRHETETDEVCVRGLCLQLLQIKDMAAYIEEIVDRAAAGEVRLPYWARVWEAALVLADYLLSLPEFAPGAPPRRVIELGAGMGVPGLFLAAAGHEVLLTDFEPEAIEFAQAAILLNGLEGRCSVRHLDWTRPDITERYDAVIGSELIYNQGDYPYLLDLLKSLRRDGAPAYLAKGPAVPAAAFLSRLRHDFQLSEVRRLMRCPDDTIPVSIYVLGRALTPAERPF